MGAGRGTQIELRRMQRSRSPELLAYFERPVLQRYTSQPNLFVVHENGVLGRIRPTEEYRRHKPAQDEAPSWPEQVRYGFRRLCNGQVCVAAFVPDLARLPDPERHYWFSFEIDNPTFHPDDPIFEEFVSTTLVGGFTESEPILTRLADVLELVNCVTDEMPALFAATSNPDLHFPLAENSKAYQDAHIQLHKLVIDGMREGALRKVAEEINVNLGDAKGRLSILETLLPDEIKPTVLRPLRDCSRVRQEVHRVRTGEAQAGSFVERFEDDVEDVVEGLQALLSWLESVYNVNARLIRRRKGAMSVLFPRFASKEPIPEEKLEWLKRCVGKTVHRVEFGIEQVPPGGEIHHSEAIVLHFTDGSSVCIRVGSNVLNLKSEGKLSHPSDVTTDLMVFWAPGAGDETC